MEHARKDRSPIQRSKVRINWTHPVTLLFLTTMVSATGWEINRILAKQDSSDLRLQIEGVTQGINLLSNDKPSFNGEPVLCDTAKLTLLLAHSGDGKRPIMVNDIAIKAERIAPDAATNKVNCAVDTLSSRPFGIILRSTYILDVSDSSRSGRFIESAKPGEAWKVDPDNILQVANRKQAISLEPNEVPTAYDVFVEAQTPGLYRVWFTAGYDVSGPRTAKTQSFILGK